MEVADFLAGNCREVMVVDCRFSRLLDLRLICPVSDPILSDQNEVSQRLYGLLHRLIQDHSSTLVFANSRNGAERVLYNLRQRYPQFCRELLLGQAETTSYLPDQHRNVRDLSQFGLSSFSGL